MKQAATMILGFGALAACAGQPTASPATVADGSNARFSHVEYTSSSRDAVWAVWTDVESWSRWDTGLRAARMKEPMRLGARGRLMPKRGVSSRFEITTWVPGERYAFTTALPGASLVVERSFVEGDGATAFKHEVWFEGPRAQRWAERYGPQFRAELPVAMERLAAIAEGR